MKLFRRKPPPPVLTRTESLACVPHKSPSISWQKMTEDNIRIEYQLPIKPFFLQLTRRFKPLQAETLTKKLDLDKLGSTVWLMIDGQRDVKTIITDFAAASGLSPHEAEISVTSFLRELGRRGLLVIAN